MGKFGYFDVFSANFDILFSAIFDVFGPILNVFSAISDVFWLFLTFSRRVKSWPRLAFRLARPGQDLHLHLHVLANTCI